VRAQSSQIDAAKLEAYRTSFIKHVHLLVWQGYSRLNRAQLQTLHEPAITGLICEQIEKIFDDPNSPNWVDDYEIHDDPPVHHAQRQGKNRRRVDLKFVSRRFRPRTRLCFEAKCLNKTAGVAEYLGNDGLGQFISGGYAAADSHAGMLAYVQSDDNDTWCSKISKKITTKNQRITKDGAWMQVTVAKQIPHCYRTKHSRPRSLGNLVVFHVVFQCF